MIEPSFKVAKVSGIPIRIHWTFILLVPLGWYYYINFGRENLFFFLVLLVCVSVCVILHELGHAIMAKQYNVVTDDIILSPFFGLARLQKIPSSPKGEFLIAAMGPLVNVMLSTILCLYLQFSNPKFIPLVWDYLYDKLMYGNMSVTQLPTDFSRFHFFVTILFFVNASLALFNLIPAFPMDGGRMLRAAIHQFTDKVVATRVSVALGIFIASLIIFLSIYTQLYSWILAGVFISYMALSEYRNSRREQFRNQFIVKQMMKTQFTGLQISDSFTTIQALFLRGYEKNFLVFDKEELKGILTKEHIIHILKDNTVDFQSIMLNICEEDTIFLTPKMKTDDALDRMREKNVLFLPVKQGDTIIGVLDQRSIYDYLLVQQQLSL